MLLAFSTIDALVVGLGIVALLAVLGIAHFRGSAESEEGSDASALSPWLSGTSLAVAWLGAVGVALTAGTTYTIGWRWSLVPVALIVALIPVLWIAVPLFVSLGIATPYEYLERRFGGELRTAASITYLIWRGLWLLALLVLPARLMTVAGFDIPQWLVVLMLGVCGTTLAWSSGLRGIARFDTIVYSLLLATAMVLLTVIISQLPQGWFGLWRTAGELGRTEFPDRGWHPADEWSLYAGLPGLVISALAFYLVDHVATQRWLAAGSVTAARISLTLQAFLAVALLILAAIAGIGLVVLFTGDAAGLRPIWVANVDPKTGQSQINPATGQPYIDFREDRLDVDTLPQLVEEGRLLRKNAPEPLTSSEGLIDAERGRIKIEELRMTRPSPGLLHRPEPLLHAESGLEIWPYTVGRLPAFWAGIGVAAFAAAAISAFAAGLQGLATVLLTDLVERHESLRDAWATRQGESDGEWSDASRQKATRLVVLIAGCMGMIGAIAFVGRDDAAESLIRTAGILAGPLVGLFTLGIASRRATQLAALIGFALGIAAAIWTYCGASEAGVWPFGKLALGWSLVTGFVVTHVVGYALSWIVGTSRSDAELQGLVLGRGELGILKREPAAKIEIGELPIALPPGLLLPEPDAEKKRWKGSPGA